jgi:hypothetical protein
MIKTIAAAALAVSLLAVAPSANAADYSRGTPVVVIICGGSGGGDVWPPPILCPGAHEVKR